MENSQWLALWDLFADKYMSSATRGVVILGTLFLIFWVFKRPWMDRFRVTPPPAAKAKPLKEAFLTFSSYIVYAIAASVVALAYKAGYTVMYTDVSKYGWFYTVASVFIFMFYVDTMFYWSHWIMHKSRLVYKIHVTHHQFVNVTPWAAYAFHTGEAIVNAGAFMIGMLVIPWHPMALLAFVIISVTYNGVLHLGYDFFPKSWRTNPVMKWMTTTTHHVYHHQKSNCNYSFFFTFWDKVMKTEKLPD